MPELFSRQTREIAFSDRHFESKSCFLDRGTSATINDPAITPVCLLCLRVQFISSKNPDLLFFHRPHFRNPFHSGRDDRHDPTAVLAQDQRLFAFTLMRTNRLSKNVLQQLDHFFAIAVKKAIVPSTTKAPG